jgi:hypothetical protein
MRQALAGARDARSRHGCRAYRPRSRRRESTPGPAADRLSHLRVYREDQQSANEIMTRIVAGHETTASTLNWTWYLFARITLAAEGKLLLSARDFIYDPPNSEREGLERSGSRHRRSLSLAARSQRRERSGWHANRRLLRSYFVRQWTRCWICLWHRLRDRFGASGRHPVPP